jgi:hypothetical protein
MTAGFIRSPLTAGITWFLAYLGARMALDASNFEPGVRIAIAVIPALPFGWFLSQVVRGVSTMDELHRKVHLEALAIAYPVMLLILMTLGLLELAVILPKEDLSYRHIWAFMPLVYFASLGVVWRRYR